MIFGAMINWWFILPIIGSAKSDLFDPIPISATDYAEALWGTQTRYLGVGAMLVGGVWTLIKLRSSLYNALKSSFKALRTTSGGSQVDFYLIIYSISI